MQTTFQACSISEARYLYDQLAVVAPILVSARHIKGARKAEGDQKVFFSI